MITMVWRRVASVTTLESGRVTRGPLTQHEHTLANTNTIKRQAQIKLKDKQKYNTNTNENTYNPQSPNSARANSCNADTNAIKRQTEMKMKVLIPHSPQSLHEHNLANTDLFVFSCISYYLFFYGNPLTQHEHTFANCSIFFSRFSLLSFLYTRFTATYNDNFFDNNLKTVCFPILAHLSL